MSGEKKDVVPADRVNTGYAIYAVVQSEIELSAARAITVYGSSMTSERFVRMALGAYVRAEHLAREFEAEHQRQQEADKSKLKE